MGVNLQLFWKNGDIVYWYNLTSIIGIIVIAFEIISNACLALFFTILYYANDFRNLFNHYCFNINIIDDFT